MIHDYLPIFVSLAATFVFAFVYSYLQDAVRQRSSNMKRPKALILIFALYTVVFLLIGLIMYLLTVGIVELMRGRILGFKGF